MDQCATDCRYSTETELQCRSFFCIFKVQKPGSGTQTCPSSKASGARL
jgi:hypothetical protein